MGTGSTVRNLAEQEVTMDHRQDALDLLPTNQPLVTCVCLTTYPKRASMLPDALRSYRHQDYPAKELLVVNDGSPLASVVQDVRVVNLPDRTESWTIGEKRNVGIREAHGEFLAVWDDDDLSLPWRLKSQVQVAIEHNADCVLTDNLYVSDENLNLVGSCNRGIRNIVYASALIRRNAMVRAGGYDRTNYGEDVGLVSRIRYLVRGNIVTMQEPTFYVLRRHSGSTRMIIGDDYKYFADCATKNRDIVMASAVIRSVTSGPGENDVIGVTP